MKTDASTDSAPRPGRRRWLGTAVLGALGAGTFWRMTTASGTARTLPPFAGTASGSTATQQIAVLAGGCFWGVQGVFQHVTGVLHAVPGYAGGAQATAPALYRAEPVLVQDAPKAG